MDYEKWMTRKELGNDGEYAYGYIDGKPAKWELSHLEDYTPCVDGDTFGVDYCDQYEVCGGVWK